MRPWRRRFPPRLWIALLTPMIALSLPGDDYSAEPADAPPSAERFEQLTAQLGAASLQQREQATAELLQAGMPAMPALDAAVHAVDAEVRARARQIRAVVDEANYQQRIKEFAADSEDRRQLDLPGWSRFRKLVGEDAACRRLFVAMARDGRPLLESIERGPKEVGKQFEDSVQTMHQLSRNARDERVKKSAVTLAVIVFAASDSAVPLSAESAGALAEVTCCSLAYTGLTAGEYAPQLKTIWRAWLRREFDSEKLAAQMLSAKLLLSLAYDLSEGFPLAEATLKQPGQRNLYRSLAILTVGKFGKKEHLELLAPQLTDDSHWLSDNKINTTALGPAPRIGFDVQVRDLALAMSIHLSGGDLRDFGFQAIKDPADIFPHYSDFLSQQLQFRFDAMRQFDLKSNREAAHKKWAATQALANATAAKDQAAIEAATRDLQAATEQLRKSGATPRTTIPDNADN